MPIYSVNGKSYDIPEDKTEGFEKRYPEATIAFQNEGKSYNIPLSKRDAFLKKYPNASYYSDQPSEKNEVKNNTPVSEENQTNYMAGIEQMRKRTQELNNDFNSTLDRINKIGFSTDAKPIGYRATDEGLKQEYITPYGNITVNKFAADMEAAEFKGNAFPNTLMGQRNKVQKELVELRDKAEARKRDIAKSHIDDTKERYKGSFLEIIGQSAVDVRMQNSHPTKTNLQATIDDDNEYRKLIAAIHQKEEQLATLSREIDRNNGIDVGFWRGFGDVMKNPNTWDFGINDLQDALAMHSASSQYAKSDGEQKTNDDLMSAIADNRGTTQLYGDNDSNWYRWGNIAGHVPAFVVDFALTGGGYTGIKIGAKTGVKLSSKILSKEITEEIAQKGFKSYIKNNGLKGLGNYAADWSIKAIGVASDDIARGTLMANTIQIAKTSGDAVERKLGNVTLDDSGKIVFDNNKSWGDAIWQSEANAIIENFSEMFGTHLPSLSFKSGAKLADVFGAKRLSNVLLKADAGALGIINAKTNKLFSHLGISDITGEITEEYYGQLWRSCLNLDDAYSPVRDENGNIIYDENGNPVMENNFLSGRFHADIWGGMALSMGLMKAPKTGVSAITYVKMKHDVNKADNRVKSMLGDTWEELKVIIDQTTNNDIGSIAEKIVSDIEMTDNEKAAVLEYMEKSLYLRGYNLSSIIQKQQSYDENHSIQDESFLEGYNTDNADVRRDLFNTYKELDNEIRRKYALDEDVSIDEFIDSGEVEDNDLIQMYRSAKWKLEGAYTRAEHDIDDEVAEARSLIEARKHQDSGFIVSAITYENEEVDIVKGDINTSETIVVRHADGSLEMINPSFIKEVAEPIDAETLIFETEGNIRTLKGEEIASQFNGTDEVDTEELANGGENIPENDNIAPQNIPAMQRIPKDEQGNPIYEQTDSDTAWDAIVEQTEGDEAMAQTVADGMVADKEAALKKLEKAKSKGGATIAEKIAAEKERKAAIDAAQQELEIWKQIAGTANRRRVNAESERNRIIAEENAMRQAEEERVRAEREEAERIEREALNGVPDMVDDTPQDARARGYRRVSGHKINRQEPLQAVLGKEVAVRFSDDAIANGRVAVIDAAQLQPSHIQGVRNPLHFIDEAQPKERNDEASVMSARKIAGNIRPEEITSSVTAYTGAPTVNARGEAIQGNNRSDALRLMWESHQDQAAQYKQYLIDHAEEFGLNVDDIATMERPVLVNMLDVDDAEAINLGQYVAQDTESGGTERIKPKNALLKIGNDMRSFANLLLKSNDEETSFAGLVDNNGVEVLKWLERKGYISPTQYRSAFDSKGKLTAEAKNDLRGIMYQSIFKNGSTRLEEMFNAMPAKAQKAILATAFRDYDSPNAERMIEEIQNSIRAFYALSHSEAFMSAKTFKDARSAVEAWKRQYQFDDVTGESYIPAENFSNFALLLATMYKGENQSFMQSTFNSLFDLIQGTQEPNLFEQPDNTPRTLAQAIKEVLNLDYNGQQRSNVLVGDNSASQRGQQGSTGDAATGERIESGERTADSAGSIESGSGQGEVGTLFQYFTGSLAELISQAKQSAQELIKKVIAPVSTRLKEDLSAKGIFIDDEYKHVIDNNAVRHTLKKHSGKNEEKRGQIPIVEADFDRIADVVENYDEVEVLPGNTTAQRIIYQKAYPDGTVMFVEEQRIGRKELAAVTMWKKRNPTLTDANRTETTQISDLNGISDNKDTTNSQTTNELGEKNAVSSIQEQIQAAEAEKDLRRKLADFNVGDVVRDYYNQKLYRIKKHSKNGVSTIAMLDEEGNEVGTIQINTHNNSRYSLAEAPVKAETPTISQESEQVSDQDNTPYSITPAQYTTKKGKVLDMHLVKFAGTLTKEQQRAAKELAKAEKGWYDREQGGFMMRSEESAKSLAGTILGNEEAVSDAQPVSMRDIAKINSTNSDLLSDEGATDDKVIVSNAIGKTFTRIDKSNDGTPYEASLTFTGIEDGYVTLDANLVDFGGPHKMSVAEAAEALRIGRWQEKVSTEAKNEGQFGLVSDERMAELKERLRKKLGGQLNVGIDPEILAIGLEIAVGHIDRGVKSFTDFAKVMIADLGDVVRPYLKAFYNGARDLPEVTENGLANEMTSYEEVQQFNVATIGKEHSDPFTTAEIVVAEQAHNQEAEQAKQEIINQRNNERRNEDEQTSANTETVASETEVIASKAESNIETATTEEQLNNVVATIDKQIEEVNKQLALLGYYEADIDDSQFHESYGYMRSAEKKAVKDADTLAKRIVKDLGIDPASIVDKKGKKRKVIAQANIAPAGGDVSIRLPLTADRELYIDVLLAPDYKGGNSDNLFIEQMYLRIEDPTAGGYKQFVGRNVWVQSDVTYTDMLDEIRAEIIQHVPEFDLPAKQSTQQKQDAFVALDSYNGFKRGEKVMYTPQSGTREAVEATIHDFEEYGDHKPVLDTGLAPVLYEVVEWSDIKPIENEINVKGTKKSNKKNVSSQKQTGGLFDGLFAETASDNINNNDNGLQRNDATRSEGVSADSSRYEKGLRGGSETGSESEQQGSRGTDNGRETTGDAVNRTVRPRLSNTVEDKGIEGKRKKDVENNRKLADELKGVTLFVPDTFGVEHELSGFTYYELENVFHFTDNINGQRNATRKELDAILKIARKNNGKEENSEPKNTRNNHSERGKDHAPTSVDARIEANIKAIELAKELLESGEQATEKQMQTLRKFSGWGGLGKAFSEGTSYAPNNIAKKLRELLGEAAYQQAVMSAKSAYYTPAYVVDTLWDIAEQMGFEGGNILEGSAGIGNILGQMPTHISEQSDIHAIEIDGTSGGILSLLYPDAKVDIQGFEETRIANGSVDLAITNVPFVTGLLVNDTTGDKDLSKKFHNIHDFCIAKNVRKLREGGLGIFITSNGTLDNSKKLRDWIVSEGGADFVGAFRMHNKTFGGTGVTSDIIVIRKRVNGKKSANAIDVSTVTGVRVAEYKTGETRKVKGQIVPIVKQLSMDYNQYFVEHPEMMAGEMHFRFEKGDTTFRPASKGLYPKQGMNQEEMLANFVQSFTAEEFGRRNEEDEINSFAHAMQGKKLGEMFVNDGELYTYTMQGAQPISANSNKVKGHTKVECFEAYNAIKEALNDVLSYQTENESNEGLQPLLDKLNKAYDKFVATYGHFNKNSAIAFLRNDVDYANVFALEKYEETGDAQGNKVQHFGKTDVFSRRVVEKEIEPAPTNVKDGIVASIFKYGRIDVPYIAEHLNKSTEEIKKEIIESGYGFEDPATRQIEVSYLYLSGNVREKLRQAQENNENGVYDKNIKALQEVIPMDIPAHLIDFTLGSSWIEPKLYEEYVKERTEVGVQFTAVGGTWFMNEPYFTNYEKNRAMGVRSEMLGRTIMGHSLIEAAIQNKSITVSSTRKNWDGSTETITDKEATQACAAKIDEIRQDFKEWARQKMQSDTEMSERMERIYNDTFNNYVPMSIPDDFVPEYFGGASHKFKMRPHQGRAIVRGTMQPLLLAHEVGTGKTFTLISTAMEMRRLGTARKPMIVVQNATVGQFVESAKELYPNAKILTLEEADRSAEGRKNFYAKIKYNDWDMIVVPQSTFEFIPDSEERQMAFVQDKIEEKMLVLEQMKEADPDAKSMITRQAEREIELLEEQLAGLSEEASKKRSANEEKNRAVALQNAEVKALEMLDRRTDDVENFDDMGIDALLIDEAHEYKHLGFATAMQRGVKGVDPSYSKKSQGVFLKTQAVLEKNNGRNVIFATGTPISNTAAEIWTFMRYLMPADTMKEYGIYYFDDFVRNFGNIQQMLEFSTSGKFKENNRFAGYVNLPELVRIWSGVADTVLTKEAGGVKDKIPEMEGGKAEDLYLPQTRALRSIMKFVKAELERYDKMSGKQKKENSHIPLTMYGIAKAAAVDARLVQSDAEDDTNSKTNEAVRQTLRSLKETADYKGTVAIFADNYQNKESGFNLYEDIREKLIAEGVPADEIVVMKSGMTIKKKLEIFEKVNRGEVRVILGSTFTLGTGVNIQERLHTLIHLDAPNRPMDYTQRNGRILRQGNLHKAMGKPVRILRFGVEDSLDVTAYQRLKTKGAIADSIMNGKQMMSNSMTNRVLEEEEDVFGDTVAQLSGSEYAMLKNNAEKNVRKFASRKKQWEADQTYVHNAIPKVKGFIKDAEKRIEDNSRYLEAVRSEFPNGKAKEIVIGKHRFSSVEAMEDYLKEYNKIINAEVKKIKEGEIAGDQTRELSLSLGNYIFKIKTRLYKEMNFNEGAGLFYDVHRKMTYSCPELGLDDVPVKQSLLRNAIEDITQNVITGVDFAERLETAERSKKHNEAELEQLLSREGKPFDYEAELEQAKAQYEEYAELMKKELEQKEAKYAEMDANIETADNIVNAEEDDILERDGNAIYFNEEEAYQRMAELIEELAKKLHLDNIEVVTDVRDLEGKKRRAKGFYSKSTGKINIVIPNHRDMLDVEQTLLHEAVAHYGLRQLFGEEFETFLDNIYAKADKNIRERIVKLAAKNGWDFRKATEEYLASLAENTEFENCPKNWWNRIKEWFKKLLNKFGFSREVTLNDNSLRYILWRSYENLKKPANKRNTFDIANDIAKQYELKIGNFAENFIDEDVAKEYIKLFSGAKDLDIRILNSPEDVYDFAIEMGFDKDVAKESAEESKTNYVGGGFYPKSNIILIFAFKDLSTPLSNMFHEHIHYAIEQLGGVDNVMTLSNELKVLDEELVKKIEKEYDTEDVEEEIITYSLELALAGNAIEDLLSILSDEAKSQMNALLEIVGYNKNINYARKNEKFSRENREKNLGKIRTRTRRRIAEYSIERGNGRNRDNRKKWDSDFGVEELLETSPKKERREIDDELLFREAEKEYNYDVSKRNLLYKFQEGWQDSMLSLKKFQEAVLKETGKKMKDWWNAYLAENAMSSKNKTQAEAYKRDFFNPLWKEIERISPTPNDYTSLVEYIVAKHGLERNEIFSKREAEKSGNTWDGTIKDYSGLSSLTGEKKNFTEAASLIVEEFEKRYNTSNLWKAINRATKRSLEIEYDGGLISKETFNEVKDMFNYYIPLRGWQEDVAADIYEYINNFTPITTPVIKKAKGRSSIADDPFATIGYMGESAIVRANRNLMKQKFLNFVLANPTNLATVSEMWFVKHDGEWIAEYPEIPENATGEEANKIIEEFNARMEALGDNARKEKGKLKIGYRTKKNEEEQHIVKVKRLGKEFVIYINGNPTVAQAVNGLTNPETTNDAILKATQWIKNNLARNLTSRNPEFIMRNMSRDIMWSSVSISAKENFAYNLKFQANINREFWAFRLPVLVRKWENGTLNTNIEEERLFDEFMRNGGETGFTQVHTVDDYKRDIKRLINKAKGTTGIISKSWRATWDGIEFLNRSAEDLSRFAVYMTSRQMGRTIARSIYDAKEVTVNFNKKGRGSFGARYFGLLYMFFNATIQGLANVSKLIFKHPAKMAMILSSVASTGFLLPALAVALSQGDDDDESGYWDLPEWVRRNSAIIYIPGTEKGYITIPLSHELRPFYALGEIFFSCMSGKEDIDVGMKKAGRAFTGLLPIDFNGHDGNILLNLCPDAIKPIAQTIANVDYFGKPIYKSTPFNEFDPEWSAVYKGTNGMLVNGAKFLSDWSGGDNVEKGRIDINPAIIEHITEGYLGGIGTTINKTYTTISMIWDEDARQIRSVPVVRSFVQAADERNNNSQINKEYYETIEDAEKIEHLFSGYKEQTRMGAMEYAEKLNELINSPEFERYKIAFGYKKYIDKYNGYLKYLNRNDRQEIEKQILNLKKEMLKEIEALEN